ncbi:hypothetical protein ACTQ31_03065 [Clostridium butyricum]|uniref:hypothetical protein n=1 Tax=Clostridium butyricum TaxID=1492 RepID=UPI003F8EFB1B
MRIKRKRKGSSLIFVVIMFMFVIIVSSAMLSMVSSNYAGRVTESKRVKNLYGAESGLDIAYNVIAKTIDNANEYSYNKTEIFKDEVKNMNYTEFLNVKDENSDEKIKNKARLYALYADIDYLQLNEDSNKSKIEEDNKKIDELINYVFRIYFKDYINANLYSNICPEGENSGKGKYALDGRKTSNDENNLQEVIYNNARISFKLESLDENSQLKWSEKDSKVISGDNLVTKYYFDDEDKIRKETYDLNFNYYEKITLPINLISNFKEQSNVGENEREIESVYTMIVPNYDEVAFKKSVFTNDIPGLTVGGTLSVNAADLDVYGDILVEGDSSSLSIYDNKYNTGILINSDYPNNKNKINFYNNVYCRKTFNIKDNVRVNINKDLYAQNIYVNTSKQNTGTYIGINNDDNSKVVLDNDLEMNAKNTVVNIKNFYGVNGKTIDKDSGKDEKSKKSSSIIINNTDDNRNSFLTIENEAYINGVANIKTENGYQTGESVAVKGNYDAYSMPVENDDKFKNDAPLKVLDTDDINKKIDHFHKYWISNLDKGLDHGGVIFNSIKDNNKVKSIGDIVYGEKVDGVLKAQVQKANYANDNVDVKGKIDSLKKTYAMNMYNLNIENKKDENYVEDINDSTFEKIQDAIVRKENHEDVDLVGFKYKNENYTIDSSINSNKFKGVMVVNGDLTISTNYEIEGNLIVTGNIIIKNDAKVTLKYNKDYTKNIQNKNLSIFNQIFPNMGYGYSEESSGSDGFTTESNSTIFIKNNLWKINK